MDLAVAYTECARLTRREARNFYFAFLSLPPLPRRSIYALYAFCREADDLVDADAGGSRQERLASLRARLRFAAEGRPTVSRDLALSDTIQRYGVDPCDLDAVLIGMQMDLDASRIPDAETLDNYCYHVASAVGLATLPVLNRGVPPSADLREAAVHLGKGMQLVNILRDVAEDLVRDRIYLPDDLLQRHGVDDAAWACPQQSPALRAVMAELARQAMGQLLDGRKLVQRLPKEARACPWLLAEIYQRVLERIEARDYDVFSERVSVPRGEKLWLLASARWRAR